jgi:hypothetical protein
MPGTCEPALLAADKVRSTPRCGSRESLGTRKPSTSSSTQTKRTSASVMARPYPGLAGHNPGKLGPMIENLDPADRDAQAEADAAAAEAAEVGGPRPNDEDPERRPVEEAGGGESEGFEGAEDALREHAEHGDPSPDPKLDAFEPEIESDRETGASRGQPDEPRSTERTGEP